MERGIHGTTVGLLYPHRNALCRDNKGCSGMIQYSRNLIWPQSIFFILNVWRWFSYGISLHENSLARRPRQPEFLSG